MIWSRPLNYIVYSCNDWYHPTLPYFLPDLHKPFTVDLLHVDQSMTGCNTH